MKRAYKSLRLLALTALLAVAAHGAWAQSGAGKVTVVIPAPAREEAFMKAKIAEFARQNPSVKVELTVTPNDNRAYGNAVNLMFASDEAPDIFRVSGSLPTSMRISHAKGWLHPLDEYLTDSFRAQFADGMFASNGGMMIGGKTYGIPFIEGKYPAFRPFLYNMDVLGRFGFGQPALTWGELEAMAAKVSRESNGSAYGFTLEAKSSTGAYAFSILGETVATNAVDIHQTEGNFVYDATTGRSNAANEGAVGAAELIKRLHKAKAMVPGWEAGTTEQVYQQMASGRVAIAAGQSFWIANIVNLNPRISIKVARPPARTAADRGHRYIYTMGDPYWAISSRSKDPKAAWSLIEFFSSLKFQEDFFKSESRVTVGYARYAPGTMPDFMTENMRLAGEFIRLAPNPADKHPDADPLIGRILANAPKPVLNDLYLLSIVRDTPFQGLARDYDAKMDAVVDAQIEAMRNEGSSITRDALVFPSDWNRTANYIRK